MASIDPVSFYNSKLADLQAEFNDVMEAEHNAKVHIANLSASATPAEELDAKIDYVGIYLQRNLLEQHKLFYDHELMNALSLQYGIDYERTNAYHLELLRERELLSVFSTEYQAVYDNLSSYQLRLLDEQAQLDNDVHVDCSNLDEILL